MRIKRDVYDIFNIIGKNKNIDEYIEIFESLVIIKRTPIFTTRYYLGHILLVLNTVTKWEGLKLILDKNSTEWHYRTIEKKHLEWSKLKLYEKAYKIMNKKHNQTNFKDTDELDMYIDTANIYNKNGSEQTGYGINPKKKESRITCICDNNKNIHALSLIPTIKKTKTKNTFPHDSHTIEYTLNDLKTTNPKFKVLNIIGDKGYCRTLKDKNMFKEQGIILRYPNRKNQKAKTTEETKEFLKRRYLIENVFADLKRYNRICIRKDKLECTYTGFLYLGAVLNFKTNNHVV